MILRIWSSLCICIASAVLETLCTGTNVEQRFKVLAFPAYSLSRWSWFVVGGFYYAMCFFILYRILGQKPGTRSRSTALALVVCLMVTNAAWNLAFFQPGHLLLAFAVSIPYVLLALALFISLLHLDRMAKWAIVPYLAYLVYVTTWTYAVWELNGSA